MPVPHYGVWVCKAVDIYAEPPNVRTPHIYLQFNDNSSGTREAAINVEGSGQESRLVYKLPNELPSEVTRKLEGLKLGFHLIQDFDTDGNLDKHRHHHLHYRHQRLRHTDLQGLDYQRTEGLVNILEGEILEYDTEGPNNDLREKLVPLLEEAKKEKDTTTVYIFGSSYGSGIHNIHMNQGSHPKYDNGIYSDGALLFRFGENWKGVFLAFASQMLPTDYNGLAEPNSESLAQSIMGT